MASPSSDTLHITIHRNTSDTTPAHHVITNPGQSWASYLTSWNSGQNPIQVRKSRSQNSSREGSQTDLTKLNQGNSTARRIGFQNPWPSWHKPTRKEVWDSLEWGEDLDPCIELAVSHLPAASKTHTRMQMSHDLLRVQEPDFDFDPSSGRAKTTWLGHAGVLLQLPALEKGAQPVRCIFDPMFSNRSSPTQMAGPIRSFPPPCKIESLPPIDVFMISHNHHDHLDYETVMSIWNLNKERIRFVVPLGNKTWFVGCGIDEDKVIELDWWESIDLSLPESQPLKITCTPNQHNSGRTGLDANEALWSSWYLEHPIPEPYRIYFAGDTGYQFHPSPGWPPEPPLKDGKLDLKKQDYKEKTPHPTCPAFEEISERLGSPDLLLLPVAVGATFSFLRSYIPLPDASSPFPRHKLGVTAANHLPPWDAVHVFKLMTDDSKQERERQPIALAIHWGTFVPERTEVLKTLGQLEFACIQQDVQFGRSLEDIEDKTTQPIFLALNHGQSVIT